MTKVLIRDIDCKELCMCSITFACAAHDIFRNELCEEDGEAYTLYKQEHKLQNLTGVIFEDTEQDRYYILTSSIDAAEQIVTDVFEKDKVNLSSYTRIWDVYDCLEYLKEKNCESETDEQSAQSMELFD